MCDITMQTSSDGVNFKFLKLWSDGIKFGLGKLWSWTNIGALRAV